MWAGMLASCSRTLGRVGWNMYRPCWASPGSWARCGHEAAALAARAHQVPLPSHHRALVSPGCLPLPAPSPAPWLLVGRPKPAHQYRLIGASGPMEAPEEEGRPVVCGEQAGGVRVSGAAGEHVAPQNSSRAQVQQQDLGKGPVRGWGAALSGGTSWVTAPAQPCTCLSTLVPFSMTAAQASGL